jgi:hypothetical protein
MSPGRCARCWGRSRRANVDVLARMARQSGPFDDPEEADAMAVCIARELRSVGEAIAALQRKAHADLPVAACDVRAHVLAATDIAQARLCEAERDLREVVRARSDASRRRLVRRMRVGTDTVDEASRVTSVAVRAPTFLQQQQQQQQQQHVERQIVEMGQTSGALSALVAEQEHVVLRIDDDVEDTLRNVEGARAQLLRLEQRASLQSSYGVAIKAIAVASAFALAFIVFVL